MTKILQIYSESPNLLNNALTRESIIENQNAAQNPVTLKPGTKFDARITNKALITKENSPRVRMVSGNVISFTNGLINIFIKPKTTARTTAPIGVTFVPGKR
jgi:hypothetical protein